MNRLIYISLLMLLALAVKVHAKILVYNTNGTTTALPDLKTAASIAVAVGKTIVVTSALTAVQSNISSATLHEWPTDRVLKVEKGGNISPTTKFTGLRYAEPEWFGAYPGSTSDDSVLMNKALNSLGSNGILQFNSGVYSGGLYVTKSYITIKGKGSVLTTIKTPAGIDTNVIDVGKLADYSFTNRPVGVNISGFTLDGNKANTPAPAYFDVTGWGLGLTWVTHSKISDIRAINCWTGGIGLLVHSDFNTLDNLITENTGGNVNSSEVGLDLNSAHHNKVSGHVSNNDGSGLRILDDSVGNVVSSTVNNPIHVGAIFDNQIIGSNKSYNNKVDVAIDGGGLVTGDSVQIGARWNNNIMNISIANALYGGLHMVHQATHSNNPYGNTINLTTNNGQTYAALIGGDGNTVNIISSHDGRSGAALDFTAVKVTGNNNVVSAKIIDSATSQVRSIQVLAGATENTITLDRDDGVSGIGLYGLYIDSGTRTKTIFPSGYGPDITESGAISIPFRGSIFKFTNAGGINQIGTGTYNGRKITVVYGVPTTMVKANNLKINSNFSGGAGSSITLVSDGADWYEVSRNSK